jgi:hypothetical protein
MRNGTSDRPPATADLPQAAELFREFLAEVESLYGSFLDSFVAIRHFRMFFEGRALPFLLAGQAEARAKGEAEPVVLHGRGDPNQPESRFDHRSNISEFMERIKDGGADQVRLSQPAVFTLPPAEGPWVTMSGGMVADRAAFARGTAVR